MVGFADIAEFQRVHGMLSKNGWRIPSPPAQKLDDLTFATANNGHVHQVTAKQTVHEDQPENSSLPSPTEAPWLNLDNAKLFWLEINKQQRNAGEKKQDITRDKFSKVIKELFGEINHPGIMGGIFRVLVGPFCIKKPGANVPYKVVWADVDKFVETANSMPQPTFGRRAHREKPQEKTSSKEVKSYSNGALHSGLNGSSGLIPQQSFVGFDSLVQQQGEIAQIQNDLSAVNSQVSEAERIVATAKTTLEKAEKELSALKSHQASLDNRLKSVPKMSKQQSDMLKLLADPKMHELAKALQSMNSGS